MSKAATYAPETAERIKQLFTQFKLPTLSSEIVGRFVQGGHQDALTVLRDVLELEAGDRRERRVDRLRRASKLPPGKTFETLQEGRLPRPLLQKLRDLSTGAFLERADNVLAFGLPGVGKSHAACALAHALVQAGHAVLFAPTYQLVQDLLAAKRNLQLPRMLRSLDVFELLILDDIGYVQHDRDEMEVLFTLLAERYERKSVVITTNLVFSDWTRIFKDPLTTLAAIDRVVHHSVILDLMGMDSFRAKAATTSQQTTGPPGHPATRAHR